MKRIYSSIPLVFTAIFSRRALCVLTLVLSGVLSQTVLADVEKGRQLMEQSRFTEAMQAFLPAAQAGNADAEELIGVMYAMGLGVERDDRRAFEWYLRASMKAHPGAQSGIGWYYEVGRGVAKDLVRAYMWYVLSAIGGDPDAAISQEEVIKKMTKEQVKAAQILIADYKMHLYPYD
ncbi:MAG: tetratricopeptide repeat protein [Leucothrix sp.]